MKALVWYGDTDLRLEDVPAPAPASDEVSLNVELAGICGSDLHGYRGHPGPRVPPLVLGHEAVGTVEGVRYAIYPLIGCGNCAHCAAGRENLCASWQLVGMHRPGVFAEQISVPRTALVPIDDLDAERAVLTEPLACAVAALRPHELGPGSLVVVLGCGPIGLLAIALAADQGAEVLATDPLPERRAVAERLGASSIVDPAARLGEADLVVDAAGFADTWRTALELVRSGGDIVVLGLGTAEGPFAMNLLVRRAIRMRGQFAYSRDEFEEALRLLEEGELLGDMDWLTTDALADGAQAFERLVSAPERYLKVLLKP